MENKKMNLQEKLLALQKAVKALQKDTKGGIFKGGREYEYLSGDKLLSVVRPAMDELGLRLTMDIIYEGVKFSPSDCALIPFRFTWVDTETGDREEHSWFAGGSNTPVDKAIGSAITYAERYFIMKQLHLQTDCDDTDALREEDFKREPAPAATKAPAPDPSSVKMPLQGSAEPLDFLPKGVSFSDWQKAVANCAAGVPLKSGERGIGAWATAIRLHWKADDKQVQAFTEAVQKQIGVVA